MVVWRAVERELFVVRPVPSFFVPLTLEFLGRLGEEVLVLSAGEGRGNSYVTWEGSCLTLNLEFLGVVARDSKATCGGML